MITVVTWKWRPPPGYRSSFGAEQVNILRSMVERHLHLPHEFVCVTDDPQGIDPRVRIVPLWDDLPGTPEPAHKRPSCFRRLRAWAPDAAEWLGERIWSLDLDCVIVDDVTPLVDRPEDVVLWGDTNPSTPYNGSSWLLRAGSRPRVWTEFDPLVTPQQARALGYHGSDQSILSLLLGPGEPKWTTGDGVYSFRNHLLGDRAVYRRSPRPLKPNTRIVFFHGQHDPWDYRVKEACPWVREHYH